MKAKIFLSGLCVLGLAALVSCTEKGETVIDSSNVEICFSTSLDGVVATKSVSEPQALGSTGLCVTATVSANTSNPLSGAATRATEITGFDPDGADGTYSTFNVLGFMYSGDWETDKAEAELYIDNVPVVKDGGSWTFESKYYWPGSYDRMTFFGYAPVAVAGDIEADETYTPSLTYSDPAITADGLDLSRQYDLLIAKTADAEKGSNGSVAMRFAHVLTAVQFKCGEIPAGTITKIELAGVKYSGVYDMDAQTWTLGDETVTYEIADENGLWSGEEESTPGTEILAGPSTLMMLPQSGEVELAIEFTYYGSTEPEPATATIEIDWTAGTEVVYNISISDTQTP